MDIQSALAYGRSQLHQSPTPNLDARLLLQHLLNVTHSYLVAYKKEQLTAEQEQQFQHLINRAKQQEPIPYIIGKAPFFDFDLHVEPGVLIPRPETEQLVETAVSWAMSLEGGQVVDIGTGSGCIAIALARFLPAWHITAVDISAKALAIARKNAAQLAPNRIHFAQGSLLQPITTPIDLIVANLPYVTSGEWQELDDGVKLYEPVLALDGGADGLDFVRKLLKQAAAKLHPNGAIFLEIGWQQGIAAQEAASAIFPEAEITVLPDYAGHKRMMKVVNTSP